MNRIARVLVFLCLGAFAAAGLARDFSYGSSREARLKALELFDEVGLTMEYRGRNAQQGRLIRWERPIRVFVAGSPTPADMRKMRTFLAELALRVPEMPSITLVEDESQGNLFVHFVPLKRLKDVLPGYVPGNWGMFFNSYRDFRIVRAVVGIASDVTSQMQRNHLVMEEIVGALGLLNDHSTYADSIVYQKWTEVQKLSEVDWAMLNILYSPRLSAGMRREDIRDVMLEHWSQ